MNSVQRLHSALLYFHESAGVSAEPADSRFERMLRLRLACALVPHHVGAVVAQLHELGVGIGEYDEATLRKAMEHKLFDVEPAVWVELLWHVHVADADALCACAAEMHASPGSRSALLELKRHLQTGVMLKEQNTPALFVRVFIILYTAGVERTDALLLLLHRSGVECEQDIVLQIWNGVKQTPSADELITDIVALLGNIEFRDVAQLQRETHGAAQLARDLDLGAVHSERTCRPSLLARHRAVQQRASTDEKRHAESLVPDGIPVHNTAWVHLSVSQRQVVLLLCLMRAEALPRRAPDSELPLRAGNIALVAPVDADAELFDALELPDNRHDAIFAQASAVLQRLSLVLESSNVHAAQAVHGFRDKCLAFSFGRLQLDIMPLAMLAHLYLGAHLPKQCASACYRAVARAFNHKLPPQRPELRMPEGVPAGLLEMMLQHTAKHPLPREFTATVLRALCV
jgi:hypothetical protein